MGLDMERFNVYEISSVFDYHGYSLVAAKVLVKQMLLLKTLRNLTQIILMILWVTIS